MKHILTILLTFLIFGCTSDGGNEKQYLLQGVWTLRLMDYPIGGVDTFPKQNQTLLRLYDSDSTMYECIVTQTETGLIIKPYFHQTITLFNKGGNEYIYMEDDDPRPLTVVDDSTIIIQQDGILCSWHGANDIAKEWSDDMLSAFTADLQQDGTYKMQNYVFSAKERSLINIIYVFILSFIAVIVLLLLIVRIAVQNRKAKRQLQLQLQQIQEVQEERPQAVKQAIELVEAAYFASDEYKALRHRIAIGQKLKDEEWTDIENQLRKVYPGFGSQLRGLYAMSELQYQVCLLIKLRIAPSDIASVLARSMSAISAMRSRLYEKVFGQKGGAREWDEFILSIGT